MYNECKILIEPERRAQERKRYGENDGRAVASEIHRCLLSVDCMGFIIAYLVCNGYHTSVSWNLLTENTV